MRRIAIFDYQVIRNNPIGSCHRRMLNALSGDYDFTVFAVDFDNPAPERIAFQRVPVPRRPLALLFVAYHLMAPVCYWLYRLRHRERFDLIQTVESNLCFGSVAYAHFCHRAYLRLGIGSTSRTSLRTWVRWVDHRLHAALEPLVYRHVARIVVPSRGTAGEIASEYPSARDKIQIIHNPVDIERMRRPKDFDTPGMRRVFGWTIDDLVLVFVALGHFERKGLPVLLEAMTLINEPRLKLLVVGGKPGLVREYEARARAGGLAGRVSFTGNRADIRSCLWGADAFVFPSHYEAFSLVTLEAAAASLPLVVPLLNGVEEFVEDGLNGLVITPTTHSLVSAFRRLMGLSQAELRSMGEQAALDAKRFSVDHFWPRWAAFYESLRQSGHGPVA